MDVALTTPALLFPAISLMLIAYSTRFQALASLIRDLYGRYRSEKEPRLLTQIARLERRAMLIRNMQLTGILSNFGCVLDMLLIFFGQQAAARWVLGISMVLIMVSMAIALVETSLSATALKLQIHDLDPAIGRYPEGELSMLHGFDSDPMGRPRGRRSRHPDGGRTDGAGPASRLWDLRRGDADDNRTSPYGRGWRSVVVATALEFNYLAASIAFVALIIVPALLVGLAPPLLLTYGRQKLDAATVIGSSSDRRAVLAGRAGRCGALDRQAAAGDGRREPLASPLHPRVSHSSSGCARPSASIIERLPGQTRASAQLDRRRRIGTVLAAMLLAGGGLLLALSVGVLASPGLADVVMQPWAVAQAGLSNAAVVLGLSTAAASLYWLWRELASRRPLRDWSPAPPVGHAPIVRVAHLSDLHLVGERYGYRMECGTHGPRGNRSMRHALRKLSAIHASTPLDRVLVTGDVTDAGTRAEWVEFLDLLRCYPDIRSRVLFVPGNHDVNIVDRTNTGRFDLPWSVGHGAPPPQVRGGARCHPGRARPHRGPRVRRPRALAQGLPAGRRAPARAARARRTGHVARTMGDGQGVGRHLPAGRPAYGAGRMRRDPPRFERPQPLLG